MSGLRVGEPLTVFISARIHEMASERLAAGAVVASMRLRPVLFEHTRHTDSSRPVYLEAARTCDVFVGIYGLEYGDQISNKPSVIEQEYLETLVAPLMPRLFFIRSARGRQRRLQAFLQRATPHGIAVPFGGYADFAVRFKHSLNVLLAASCREVQSMMYAQILARPGGPTAMPER